MAKSKKSNYLATTLNAEEARLLDKLAAVVDGSRSGVVRLLIRSKAPSMIEELQAVCQGKSA